METALLSTSVDAGGDIDGNRLEVDGRFHKATSMATSINIGGSKNSLMEVCGSFQGSCSTSMEVNGSFHRSDDNFHRSSLKNQTGWKTEHHEHKNAQTCIHLHTRIHIILIEYAVHTCAMSAQA